ncbi:MAG: hypothetical protein MHPDNHAH_03507 [Anaerolineales bacterium]|nr:hypothetical protein [Anaerolineales bacterium]
MPTTDAKENVSAANMARACFLQKVEAICSAATTRRVALFFFWMKGRRLKIVASGWTPRYSRMLYASGSMSAAPSPIRLRVSLIPLPEINPTRTIAHAPMPINTKLTRNSSNLSMMTADAARANEMP